MPERIIRLSGTMRQVGKVLAMVVGERGGLTIGVLASKDSLEQEKRAEAWRTLQEQKGETDDKKKE